MLEPLKLIFSRWYLTKLIIFLCGKKFIPNFIPPLFANKGHVRLTKLSDLEKTKIFRNMLERVFQENEMKTENMYEDVDMTYRSKAEGDAASRKQHYYQMTLNEVFSIRKLEKLFILIARHCCFYACIKMDFMVSVEKMNINLCISKWRLSQVLDILNFSINNFMLFEILSHVIGVEQLWALVVILPV